MRLRKSYIIAAHDVLMAAISFLLSLYLRLGTHDFGIAKPVLVPGTLLFTLICTLVFLMFRQARSVWRYVSMEDLIGIVKAVTLAIAIFVPVLFLVNRLEGLPRSTPIINWFVLITLLGAPRFLYRALKEHTLHIEMSRTKPTKRLQVILVGLNDHTELFLREMANQQQAPYEVVALLDDDPAKHGRRIRNVEVMGSLKDIGRLVQKLRKRGEHPQKVIFAPGTLDGQAIRDLLKNTEDFGITVARLPRLTDFRTTVEEKIELRPIAVEDLLGRPQTNLDHTDVKALIEGTTVLVTGAGGTIGSELVGQIASYGPEKIVLFELAEHNLYLIDKELEDNYPDLTRVPIIGDVRDREQLDGVFKAHRPQIVFHAAALKHVPMSEKNICEAVRTNIEGTKNVADACVEYKVKGMVTISTDKAVNPTSVMGASKRAAECYVQALGTSKKTKQTALMTVRFGNVLGSSGSVVPLFRRQLEKGGPLTVTHPDMVRYFMTVREAVTLVLHASVLGIKKKEYNGMVFVLDMGDPVYIKDLAAQMIRLAGLQPGQDIEIKFTGLRAGEKLYEELFYPEESPQKTEVEGIMLAAARESSRNLLGLTKKLISACESRQETKALELLTGIVPEFQKN
jgi:O-antigen biosynthesis protein WbqV